MQSRSCFQPTILKGCREGNSICYPCQDLLIVPFQEFGGRLYEGHDVRVSRSHAYVLKETRLCTCAINFLVDLRRRSWPSFSCEQALDPDLDRHSYSDLDQHQN
jgi:hypothetical protein